MSFSLSSQEKDILLRTARESIRSSLTGEAPRYPEPTENLHKNCGAFVTLHEGEKLRGCIGHIFAVRPLFEGIKELARSSAFDDPRFPALQLPEYDEIDIEISVLTPLEKAESPEQVEVGVHGLYIKSGGRSGVLLPQVPVEQGWNRRQYLTNLCYKAGLSGDCWTHPQTELYLFTAIVFGEKE
ncbi:MAG: AmmeMemoRadiSam system protein A [Spirochaetota bacterium]